MKAYLNRKGISVNRKRIQRLMRLMGLESVSPKPNTSREGKDALIISIGITLNQALEAADSLSKDGIETSVLHIHTIKPLDQTMILE